MYSATPRPPRRGHHGSATSPASSKTSYFTPRVPPHARPSAITSSAVDVRSFRFITEVPLSTPQQLVAKSARTRALKPLDAPRLTHGPALVNPPTPQSSVSEWLGDRGGIALRRMDAVAAATEASSKKATTNRRMSLMSTSFLSFPSLKDRSVADLASSESFAPALSQNHSDVASRLGKLKDSLETTRSNRDTVLESALDQEVCAADLRRIAVRALRQLSMDAEATALENEDPGLPKKCTFGNLHPLGNVAMLDTAGAAPQELTWSEFLSSEHQDVSPTRAPQAPKVPQAPPRKEPQRPSGSVLSHRGLKDDTVQPLIRSSAMLKREGAPVLPITSALTAPKHDPQRVQVPPALRQEVQARWPCAVEDAADEMLIEDDEIDPQQQQQLQLAPDTQRRLIEQRLLTRQLLRNRELFEEQEGAHVDWAVWRHAIRKGHRTETDKSVDALSQRMRQQWRQQFPTESFPDPDMKAILGLQSDLGDSTVL